MNEVLEYVVECANKGDLEEFLKKHNYARWCIYRGNYDLDLHIYKGKVMRVSIFGRFIKLVEV